VSSEKKPRRLSDWYTISLESLKGWGFVVTLAILGIAGVMGYRFLDQVVLEKEVVRVIQEAEDLLRTVRSEGAINSYREEYFVARRHLEEARELQASGALRESFRSAERSRTLLASILSTLRMRGAEGEAMFIAVQGGVQFRRGDRGSWQSARSRVALNAGDYVKTTGNGSAEIMSVDGTLYTVRPDTVLLIGRTRPAPGETRQRTIDLEAGWVDLGTAQTSSRITTPQAEARVQRDSRAAISHDPDENTSQFSAYEGQLTVSSADGSSRDVGPLEQVVQTGASLSKKKLLPSAPLLLTPEDNYEAVMATDGKIVLEWRPVAGATRYALQVARTRFFVQNILDLEDRTETRATIGLKGTGSFVWRVAAFDAEGERGPWSVLRRFRVAPGANLGDEESAQVEQAPSR
jgi:hypothetical protein